MAASPTQANSTTLTDAIAWGVIQQSREVDQIRCSHDGGGSARGVAGSRRPRPPLQRPPASSLPSPGPTTPEPNKRCPARPAHRLEGKMGRGGPACQLANMLGGGRV